MSMPEVYMQHLMSNVDEETWVLGAILEDYRQVMPRVIEILETSESFYSEAHQKIYQAMLSLYAANKPIDLLSVTEELRKSQQLDEVGGVIYLDELWESCPTAANIEYHAMQISEPAARRNLAQQALSLYHAAIAPDTDMEDLYKQAQDISRMVLTEETRVFNIQEACNAYIEFIQNMQQRKLKLGWHEIDRATRGLIPGDVCIIMARSGVGKSAVVQTLQLDAWDRQGVASIFFSLEMPVAAVFERAASMKSGWDENVIEEMFLTGQQSTIVESLDNILYGGIYICDKANLTLSQIQRIVEGKKGLGLVIIDYMGLVQGDGNTQYERTSSIARGLKQLAKETGTVVVCVCQTSRAGGTGNDKVTLAMARDSGVTEEGCDVMIGMHRPPDTDGIILAYVLKARRGRIGVETELMFHGNTPRLVCTAKEESYVG
jgi:replicative DNA helicase